MRCDKCAASAVQTPIATNESGVPPPTYMLQMQKNDLTLSSAAQVSHAGGPGGVDSLTHCTSVHRPRELPTDGFVARRSVSSARSWCSSRARSWSWRSCGDWSTFLFVDGTCTSRVLVLEAGSKHLGTFQYTY